MLPAFLPIHLEEVFATFAFRHNVSADEIQILGDWHSDVYNRYISLSVQDKLYIVRGVKEEFYF